MINKLGSNSNSSMGRSNDLLKPFSQNPTPPILNMMESKWAGDLQPFPQQDDADEFIGEFTVQQVNLNRYMKGHDNITSTNQIQPAGVAPDHRNDVQTYQMQQQTFGMPKTKMPGWQSVTKGGDLVNQMGRRVTDHQSNGSVLTDYQSKMKQLKRNEMAKVTNDKKKLELTRVTGSQIARSKKFKKQNPELIRHISSLKYSMQKRQDFHGVDKNLINQNRIVRKETIHPLARMSGQAQRLHQDRNISQPVRQNEKASQGSQKDITDDQVTGERDILCTPRDGYCDENVADTILEAKLVSTEMSLIPPKTTSVGIKGSLQKTSEPKNTEISRNKQSHLYGEMDLSEPNTTQIKLKKMHTEQANKGGLISNSSKTSNRLKEEQQTYESLSGCPTITIQDREKLIQLQVQNSSDGKSPKMLSKCSNLWWNKGTEEENKVFSRNDKMVGIDNFISQTRDFELSFRGNLDEDARIFNENTLHRAISQVRTVSKRPFSAATVRQRQKQPSFNVTISTVSKMKNQMVQNNIMTQTLDPILIKLWSLLKPQTNQMERGQSTSQAQNMIAGKESKSRAQSAVTRKQNNNEMTLMKQTVGQKDYYRLLIAVQVALFILDESQMYTQKEFRTFTKQWDVDSILRKAYQMIRDKNGNQAELAAPQNSTGGVYNIQTEVNRIQTHRGVQFFTEKPDIVPLMELKQNFLKQIDLIRHTQLNIINHGYNIKKQHNDSSVNFRDFDLFKDSKFVNMDEMRIAFYNSIDYLTSFYQKMCDDDALIELINGNGNRGPKLSGQVQSSNKENIKIKTPCQEEEVNSRNINTKRFSQGRSSNKTRGPKSVMSSSSYHTKRKATKSKVKVSKANALASKGLPTQPNSGLKLTQTRVDEKITNEFHKPIMKPPSRPSVVVSRPGSAFVRVSMPNFSKTDVQTTKCTHPQTSHVKSIDAGEDILSKVSRVNSKTLQTAASTAGFLNASFKNQTFSGSGTLLTQAFNINKTQDLYDKKGVYKLQSPKRNDSKEPFKRINRSQMMESKQHVINRAKNRSTVDRNNAASQLIQVDPKAQEEMRKSIMNGIYTNHAISRLSTRNLTRMDEQVGSKTLDNPNRTCLSISPINEDRALDVNEITELLNKNDMDIKDLQLIRASLLNSELQDQMLGAGQSRFQPFRPPMEYVSLGTGTDMKQKGQQIIKKNTTSRAYSSLYREKDLGGRSGILPVTICHAPPLRDTIKNSRTGSIQKNQEFSDVIIKDRMQHQNQIIRKHFKEVQDFTEWQSNQIFKKVDKPSTEDSKNSRFMGHQHSGDYAQMTEGKTFKKESGVTDTKMRCRIIHQNEILPNYIQEHGYNQNFFPNYRPNCKRDHESMMAYQAQEQACWIQMVKSSLFHLGGMGTAKFAAKHNYKEKNMEVIGSTAFAKFGTDRQYQPKSLHEKNIKSCGCRKIQAPVYPKRDPMNKPQNPRQSYLSSFARTDHQDSSANDLTYSRRYLVHNNQHFFEAMAKSSQGEPLMKRKRKSDQVSGLDELLEFNVGMSQSQTQDNAAVGSKSCSQGDINGQPQMANAGVKNVRCVLDKIIGQQNGIENKNVITIGGLQAGQGQVTSTDNVLTEEITSPQKFYKTSDNPKSFETFTAQ